MMKNKLKIFAFLLVIASILLCGCKGNGKRGTTPDTPDKPSKPDDPVKPGEQTDPSKDPLPNEVPNEVRVEGIKFALVDENNSAESFEAIEGFDVNKPGPYTISKKAKTAYITFQVTADKPDQGDFKVSALNRNAYEDIVLFARGKGTQASQFFPKESSTSNKYEIPGKGVALAKGKNEIDINIATNDGTSKGIYRVVVEYAGGPDLSDPEGKTPTALIPGIYCPAQRRSDDDKEKEPYLLLVSIQGKCTQCPKPLNQGVGSVNGSEKLAQKGKGKGLRVVVMEDADDSKGFYNPDGALAKWKNSGRGYNMYTSQYNCLYRYAKEKRGFPNLHWIKEGKQVNDEWPESFTATAKKYFGLDLSK